MGIRWVLRYVDNDDSDKARDRLVEFSKFLFHRLQSLSESDFNGKQRFRRSLGDREIGDKFIVIGGYNSLVCG